MPNDKPRRTSSPADFGLLLLRFATGATLIQAGLIKALDFDTTVAFMESGGWRMPTFAAALVAATETACGALAAMIDAWAVNVSDGAFWSQPFNVPFMVAFAATALLFTGAGTYSLDSRLFGRPRWPGLVTFGLFIVGIAAAVATWILLNGSNPIHLRVS